MAKRKKLKRKTSPRRTTRRKTPARRVRRRVVTRKRIIKRALPKQKRIIKRAPPKRTPPKQRRRRKERPPQAIEYQVNVSYRNKERPAAAISLQFSVIGPPDLTKDQVIDAITDTIESEGDAPRGFKIKIVSWKGGTVPRRVPWGSLAIIAGEPATRFQFQ